MRILHLTDHYPPVLGGIETHVDALARRQAARGDDVTVFTSSPADADGRHLQDDGPVTVRRAGSAAQGRSLDPTAFDIVHAHLSVVAPFTAPLAARAARRGAATVVTVHSLWSGMGPIPGFGAALSGLRGAPVRWTAVSRVAAREVARRVPLGSDVGVLPNAVDVQPRLRTTAPRLDGSVRLVSTMRIARRKRPMQLVRMVDALSRLVDRPVRLTIVGDGPLRPRLQRHLARTGQGDRVTFTGRVGPARVAQALAESDVYVAPAILESFGLAALEARSVGLPVVGRADSGMADFIRPGVEGLLAGSDAELVECLRRLITDESLRRRISEHNRTVASPMTWTRALSAHDAVYAELTRRPDLSLPGVAGW